MAEVPSTEDPTAQVRIALREWIDLDDQARQLQAQLKDLRQRKAHLSGNILEFMKGQNLDNFMIDGGGGTIARQQRTLRPALRRETIRTQLLLQFADQPHRVAEALRAIEGIQEGDDMSVGGTVRELLTRRLPRTQRIALE